MERVSRLRSEIARLNELAKSCDKDIAKKMRALAKEMEQTASTMEAQIRQHARDDT